MEQGEEEEKVRAERGEESAGGRKAGMKESEGETNDNVLDFVEVKTLRSDSRGDHDVFGSGLESLDGVLSLFLS
jgi:hypothetical protein